MHSRRNHWFVDCFALAALLFTSLFVSVDVSWAIGIALPVESNPESVTPSPITAAACIVGDTRPAEFSYIGVLDQGDSQFELVDPATCGACPGNKIILNNAKFRGRSVSNCSIVVEVSVVAANGGGGCYVPDTTQVLCAPLTSTLAIGTLTATYTLPLSAGCCIDRPVFLRLKVISSDCPLFDPANPQSGRWPTIGIRQSGCIACLTYFLWNQDGVLYEGCGAGYSANNLISADADCCTAVPAVLRSWGRLKTQYR